jgi:hypothetical protein
MTQPTQNDLPPRVWVLLGEISDDSHVWPFAPASAPTAKQYLSLAEHTRALEEKDKRIAELEEQVSAYAKLEEGHTKLLADVGNKSHADYLEISRLKELLAGAEKALRSITLMPWFSFGHGRYVQDEAQTVAADALTALRSGAERGDKEKI